MAAQNEAVASLWIGSISLDVRHPPCNEFNGLCLTPARHGESAETRTVHNVITAAIYGKHGISSQLWFNTGQTLKTLALFSARVVPKYI